MKQTSEGGLEMTTATKSIVMDFAKFKRAVAAQFDRMQKHDLFVVDADGESLWTTYLASFPPGTNPVYDKRTEHDCAGCRAFIKRLGKVVAIIDGKLETIWDLKTPVDEGHQVVAAAMADLVRAGTIDNTFLTPEKTAGIDKNFEQLVGKVKTWEHFFAHVPAKCVLKGEAIGPKHSETRATHDVMLRGLKELTPASVETVLELIAQNSLYRGEEHKFALESFAKLQKEFGKMKTEHDRELFVWSRIGSVPGSVAKIRNTAIGTLLIDLSEGKDLEDAVKAFETVVAPANYKRPTALVTKAQVEKAKQTIQELGLTSALERRYATIADVSVANVLFADRDARKVGGDVFDEIGATIKDKVLKKVEEIPIEKFLSEILPRATTIEVLFENKHASNLVSLIAPVDPTAGRLFKWGNNFSWSYNGDMADAIKERVKAAGGSVVGDLCCRLAWNYKDDLDFHMNEPSGHHIYYATRHMPSPSGGRLDVDANAGGVNLRNDPVENIFYASRRLMREGEYRLWVHNFYRRTDGVGFEVQLEFDGQTINIAYEKALPQGAVVDVATIEYRNGQFKIVKSLPTTQTSKPIWNVNTQKFHRVNAIMLSPNFWDAGSGPTKETIQQQIDMLKSAPMDAGDRIFLAQLQEERRTLAKQPRKPAGATGVGNKHYFFMIDGCKNDGRARGFYNEFLKEELTPHRKVIEIVGSKMRTEESEDQLSGLGFSSTQRQELLCRVTGSFTRTVKVVF